MIDWIGVGVPLVATICYVGLSALVWVQGRTRATRAFVMFLIPYAVWTFGSMMWHLTGSRFWNNVLVSGIAFSVLGLVYFITVFLDLETRVPLYAALLWEPLVLVLIWSGYVVTDSYMVDGISYMQLGPGYPVLVLVVAVTYIWSIAQLARYYRRTGDRTFRNRIQYLVVGLVIQWLGGLTNAIPGVGHYPIDVAAGVVNALLIAYAILRHRLLDITIVVRRGIGYSVLTVTIAAAYLLSVFVLQELLQLAVGPSTYVTAMVLAIIFGVLYQPLRHRLQAWTDRVFFRERYDARTMIEEVSQATASILSLDELGNLVLGRITESMSIDRAVLLLAREDDGVFEPLAARGYSENVKLRLVPGHSVVSWLRETEGVLRKEAVENLPVFRGLWAQERRDLDDLGFELLVPVKFKKELIGILGVGSKLSETSYLPDDETALRTLSNQVAVAIENARLVENLQKSLAELHQTQDQLLQAEKLSAVGQLVAGVAHELNNPLTTIKGYSQLVSEEELLSQSTKEDLERINKAAERCRRIVQNLLTFARRQASEKGMCDINQILEDTLALQEYRLGVENVELVRNLQEGLPLTMADRYQLQQVFLNIVTNAQQAMLETNGGTLTVSSARVGHTIRIDIKDTGPGMTEEVKSRVFDPFFSTKAPGEGTGLGLSICYGIVQEHGGRIDVRSGKGEGEGSTFIVELPILDKPKSSAQEADEGEITAPVQSMQRILVVDDEEDILNLVETSLARQGFVVDTAKTGLEALELLDNETGEDYQLILSDLKMPGLDGIRLYSHLRYNKPGWEKRVLFMTGDTSSPETHAFLRSTGLECIVKPFDLEMLTDVVQNGLAQR